MEFGSIVDKSINNNKAWNPFARSTWRTTIRQQMTTKSLDLDLPIAHWLSHHCPPLKLRAIPGAPALRSQRRSLTPP